MNSPSSPIDPAPLRLHYNENTAGCSPAVLEALRSITREDVANYPDYGPITARVERRFGVPPGYVQLVNGLDEGVQLVSECAARDRPDAVRDRPEIVIVEPAFETYATCAEAVGARTVRVLPDASLDFPLGRVLAAITPATRLVNLTDPNNPTGLALPPGAVEAVAAAAPQSLVLVDEAYAEFGHRTAIGALLDRHPNVIVGRTFAKAYGLAALRVGALVARPDTLDRVRRFILLFNVNICAIRALDAALDDLDYLPWYVGEVTTSRERIYAFCQQRGFAYWPSAGNFVLFRIGARAGEIAAALQAQGVIVRDKSAAPGCAGCIRMTAGIVRHTEAALAALEGILATSTR